MYVIIKSTSGSEWRRLLPALEALGGKTLAEDAAREWLRTIASSTDVASTCKKIKSSLGLSGTSVLLPVAENDPDSPIEADLRQLNEGKLLLFYARPELVALRAMVDGVSPATALQRWRATAVSILEAYRRHSKYAVLLSVEAALAHQPEFHDACARHLGLKSESACSVTVDTEMLADENSLLYLVAAQMVCQDEDIQDLINELEAASIPIGSYVGTPNINCEKVYLEELGSESKNGRFHDLEEDYELLLLQLHQVQEELESYYVQFRSESEKHARAEMEKRRLEKELNWKSKELALARQKLATIYQSKSWMLTRPVRVIGRLLRGQPLRSRAA